MNEAYQRQAEIRAKCFHPTGQWEKFEPEDVEQSIVSRFEQIVARYPDRLAVQFADHRLTYAELNEAANQLGYTILQQLGVDNEPVLFLMTTDISSLISILGILKAGKCYVSLDPSYPEGRLAQIVEDSGARLLITNQQYLAQAERLHTTQLSILNLDALSADIPKHNLGLEISPEAYAYLVYTSGSTGTPKGVIETHIDVLHFSRDYINTVYVCKEDHIAITEPYSFSGPAAKTFGALFTGALLCLFDLNSASISKLATWLQLSEVTNWDCVPSVLRQVMDQMTPSDTFPAMRLIGMGGDRVTRADLERIRQYFTATRVIKVGYGISEVKHVSFYFYDAEAEFTDNLIPVGYSIDQNEVMIVGDDGQSLPVGDVGEIVIKSRFMSPGYWRRPDLTARVFSSDPDHPKMRWYWTGDLGMMKSDGCLYHMGRKDQQTKIHGVRVEMAEVEHVLWQTGWFKEVVVVTRAGIDGEQQLIAYGVPSRVPAPSVTELRQYLMMRLPLVMLPSAFVFLDALPLNVNHKVDRRALPMPSSNRPQLDVNYVAPRGEIEYAVSDIWQEVLAISPIGIHDHFLDLGGDSIRAAQIITRVRNQFNIEISQQSLLAQPTIEKMALIIVQHQAKFIDNESLDMLLNKVENNL